MPSTMDTAQLKFSLSPLDHLSHRLYFPKLLYFSVSDDDFATVTGIFRSGLAKTLQALPIYSGTLALDKDATKPGTLAIVAPYLEAGQILQNADLREAYDFATLEAKESTLGSSGLKPLTALHLFSWLK